MSQPDLTVRPIIRESTSRKTAHAADAIVDDYLGQLAHGDLMPGEELPSEAAIGEGHGVSRTTVREAIRVLVARGFVTLQQGARARVAPRREWHRLDSNYLRVLLGPGRFRQVMEARSILEPRIVELAARRIRPQHLVRLERLLDRQIRLAEAGDLNEAARREFSEADLAFHSMIAIACGNAVIEAMYEGIVEVGLEMRLASLAVPSGALRAVTWHEAIFRAIEASDAAAAREAMEGHMGQVAAELEASGVYASVDRGDTERLGIVPELETRTTPLTTSRTEADIEAVE